MDVDICAASFSFDGTSEAQAAWAAAFAQASLSFESVARAGKGQTGNKPHSYAQKHDIINAVRPALAKQGLAVLQPVFDDDSDKNRVVVLTIILGHGAAMKSRISFASPVAEANRADTWKFMGAALTYCTRYCLQAALVLEGDHDLDEAEFNQLPPPRRPQMQRTPPPSAPQRQSPRYLNTAQKDPEREDVSSPAPISKEIKVSDEQMHDIKKLFSVLGIGKTQGAGYIFEVAGSTSKDLTKDSAAKVIDSAIFDCEEKSIDTKTLGLKTK